MDRIRWFCFPLLSIVEETGASATDAATSGTLPDGPVPAKFHAYGGQLRALHDALCNPLEQQTTIVFIGDSITWGFSVPENGVSNPYTGSPRDPRDNFASRSFVNEYKRFIGKCYFHDAAPVLSNWSEAVSGQTTVSYSRTECLYTALAPFSPVTLSGSASSSESASPSCLLGYQHDLAVVGDGSTASFSFPFTGTTFTLVYDVVPDESADYQVLIDGVSAGTYSTNGTSLAYGLRRTHTFRCVRNATIQIVARNPLGATGTQHLRLEAIEVPKTCTIVNQGISGIDTRKYATHCFGAIGPSVITPDVNFAFVQLGTNDRISGFPRVGQPNGIGNFQRNLCALLDKLTPGVAVILMNASPSLLENPAVYSFSMQHVRSAVAQTGAVRGLDVIDNYAIFANVDWRDCLADGLHPNERGHAMIARNLINSLESA
jgi:lysophospholipase L1-like esterase